MQLFVRDGRIDATVYMRSNDIFLGLPYDLFVFTMLQELFAAELGLDVGRYHHMVGSLHLYETDIERAKRLLSDRSQLSFEMPPMDSPHHLGRFLSLEARLREDQPLEGYDDLSTYWRDLIDALFISKQARTRAGGDASRIVGSSPYERVLAGDLKRSA
jgi:thymidylate synthase